MRCFPVLSTQPQLHSSRGVLRPSAESRHMPTSATLGGPPSKTQSQAVDVTGKWTDLLMSWLGAQAEQVAYAVGEAELGR